MFYEKFARDKVLRNARLRQLEKRRQKENAPVTIRDLVVYPKKADFSYGESKSHDNTYSQKDSITRLIDHLQSLATMANQYHKQAYCAVTEDGSYQLKKEHQNTITRLSLNEFSLYGKKPLTMDEFAQVTDALQQMANKTHDNVHLLLSSFSVVDKAGTLLNVTLYMQGGKNAKIDTVTKGIASSIDVTYDTTTNFSQQKGGQLTSHVSQFIAGAPTEVHMISNNSILTIETAGGALFTQAVDVCLDHANKHSKQLLMGQLNSTGFGIAEFIPEQADHIVTSNSILIDETAKITPTVLHVDPRPSVFHDRHNSSRRVDKKLTLASEALSSIRPKGYDAIQLSSTPGKLSVTSPPFGSDYLVTIYQERQLGGYISTIVPQVQQLNNIIMEKQLNDVLTLRQAKPKDVVDFQQLIETNADVSQLAAQLMKQLFKSSRPNFWEYIFGSGSYKLKKEATAVIEDSAHILKQMKKLNQEEILASILPWAKDLHLKLSHIDQGFPHHFLKQMQSSITKFQEHVALQLPEDIQPSGSIPEKPCTPS